VPLIAMLAIAGFTIGLLVRIAGRPASRARRDVPNRVSPHATSGLSGQTPVGGERILEAGTRSEAQFVTQGAE
jgi:hypothetical protein